MLSMGYEPVTSMTPYMQNTPVRTLQTFLFAKKGVPRDTELKFLFVYVYCCMVLML